MVEALCVTLARAPDRRAFMAEQSARISTPLRFVDAVDGRALTADERGRYSSSRRRATWRAEMTDNEIACVLSHRKALRRFLDGDADVVALLEDDASLAPDFDAVVQALAARADAWDLVRLETRLFDDPGVAVGVVGEGDAARRLVIKRKWGLGGAGVLYHRRAAERFLAATQTFFEAYDNLVGRPWIAGVVLELDRPVVRERGGQSTLETAASRADTQKKCMRGWWRAHVTVTRLGAAVVARRRFAAAFSRV